MSDRLAITGGMIVTPIDVIDNGVVLCEGGRIKAVGSAGEIEPEPGSQIINAEGRVVAPGFIDTHFHGSGGDDVMANGAEGVRRISRALMKYGTTGYLATTVAARHEELMRAVECAIRLAEHDIPFRVAANEGERGIGEAPIGLLLVCKPVPIGSAKASTLVMLVTAAQLQTPTDRERCQPPLSFSLSGLAG